MRFVSMLLLVLCAACAADAPGGAAGTGAGATVAVGREPVVTTAPSTTLAVATPPIASPPVTSAAVPDSLPAIVTATSAPGVRPIGFERVAATVTGPDGTVCALCLWLADDGDRRQRGLMGVTDLAGADGMAFRYPGPTTGAFWMKDTVMPLSIAFFDSQGAYLDAFDMQPCVADPCPSYPTPNDFTDAVEVPLGGLPALKMVPGSTLMIEGLPCQPA